MFHTVPLVFLFSIKKLITITAIMMNPQMAVVRKELTRSRLNPLESTCRVIKAITTPETVPNPPSLLTPPHTAARIVTSRYE